MSDIESRVKKIIQQQLGMREEDIVNEALLHDDLGADSLDDVELCMATEEEFEIVIPDDAWEPLKTVKDVIEYIEERKS